MSRGPWLAAIGVLADAHKLSDRRLPLCRHQAQHVISAIEP